MSGKRILRWHSRTVLALGLAPFLLLPTSPEKNEASGLGLLLWSALLPQVGSPFPGMVASLVSRKHLNGIIDPNTTESVSSGMRENHRHFFPLLKILWLQALVFLYCSSKISDTLRGQMTDNEMKSGKKNAVFPFEYRKLARAEQ